MQTTRAPGVIAGIVGVAAVAGGAWLAFGQPGPSWSPTPAVTVSPYGGTAGNPTSHATSLPTDVPIPAGGPSDAPASGGGVPGAGSPASEGAPTTPDAGGRPGQNRGTPQASRGPGPQPIPVPGPQRAGRGGS